MEFNNWWLWETINPLYIADVMKSMNYWISGFHPLKCESIDKSDLQFSAQYCPKSNIENLKLKLLFLIMLNILT